MRTWLCKQVHISWQLAVLAAGILCGTAAAVKLPVFFTDAMWLLAATLGFVVVAYRRYRWLCIVSLATGMLLGVWRGTTAYQAAGVYKQYYGFQVQARGVLRDDVSFGKHGDLRFELQEVQLDNGPVLAGRIWVSTAQKIDIKRGDRVRVSGVISQGFGNTPASMYRATIRGVERPHPGDLARVFRDWFANGVRRAIPEPQASLGIGYLTGQRSSLPAELDEQLRVVGLTHAVVASGYNLTILVSFARNILATISKYLAAVAASGMVLSFMMITGLSPSMSRAGLVSGLSLLCWYYGRAMHPIVLLLVTAAITVLIRPAYAWGDIGWSLSFAAFAGVVIVAPLIRGYFWEPGHDPPMLIGLIIETVAAQLTTLPIILYSFGQLAVFALPANLLVLPLVPVTMACTFLAGVTSLVAPGLATIGGWPASLLLHYMTWIVGRIAELPGAQKEVHFGLLTFLASYGLLSLLSVYLWRKTGLNFYGETDTKKV